MAAPDDDLHATVAARLRRVQQRYTSGRRALVDLLAAAARPLTMPELLRDRNELALSSAYRNLSVLERAGVVTRIVTSDEHARFELTEDLTGHHHHLICGACGRVDDFTVSPQLERSLEAALDRIVAGTGFQPDHHKLDLVGTCADCA
jgi:Fur family transcriptional regulator, ferric uptake regulator